MAKELVNGTMAMALVLATAGTAQAVGAPGAEAPPGGFDCRAGDVSGLPAADAATAVDIVCGEVASVAEGRGRFTVALRPLGTSLVLTVARAGEPEGRSLVLQGFDEIPIAGRRVAEALVGHAPVEATQRADNLVRGEGRTLVTRPGARKLEAGAMAMAAGHGGTGAGFSLGFAYDTPRFAIPAELQFARSSEGGQSLSTFSLGTGGRYYLSTRSTSPFVGGGLTVLHQSYADDTDARRGLYLYADHWGPALYAEAGVQVFRLHRGRMTARVRADFPLYSLEPEGYTWDPRGGDGRVVGAKRYVAPITFGLTMSF